MEDAKWLVQRLPIEKVCSRVLPELRQKFPDYSKDPGLWNAVYNRLLSDEKQAKLSQIADLVEALHAVNCPNSFEPISKIVHRRSSKSQISSDEDVQSYLRLRNTLVDFKAAMVQCETKVLSMLLNYAKLSGSGLKKERSFLFPTLQV